MRKKYTKGIALIDLIAPHRQKFSAAAYLDWGSEVQDGPWRHPGNKGEGDNENQADVEGNDEPSETERDDPGLQEEAVGEPENPQKDRPESKSELQKLRERFQNTVKLTSHLYKDLSLKDDLRMVSIACHPYMVEYSETLRLQKLSKDHAQ